MHFNKDSVLLSLPPLDLAGPLVADDAVVAYRTYYGIDFERRIPGVQAAIGKVPVVNYEVVVQVFRPVAPRATVWVLHGYYDHVGIYDHLISYLLRHDYAVVAYDLPGHGLSTGELVAVPDFHRYQIVLKTLLERFAAQLPMPHFAVGQSTGGAILIDYLLSVASQQQVSAFRQVALLAPLVRPRNWRLRGFLHALLSLVKRYALRKFTDNSNDYSFLMFLRERDPLQSRYLSAQWVTALKRWTLQVEQTSPTPFNPLIIQGQQDGTVEWEENLVILRRLFPASEMIYYPAMRHQVVNEHPDIRHDVFAQVVRRFDAELDAQPTRSPVA